MSKEAIQKGIDALKASKHGNCDHAWANEAIAGLQALAEQPAPAAIPPDANPAEWKDAAWKVWKLARTGNNTIPSHWLDAMRDLAIAAPPAQQPAPVQQEPVAFYRCNGCGHAYEQVHPTSCDCMEGSSFEQVNYYTSPQPAPVQQEPVAWGIIASNTGRICQVELDADEVEGHNPKHIVPLYTTPQPPAQQEPVAWYEHNPDLDAWFLAYTHNPKAKTRPLIFGDIAPQPAQRKPLTDEEIDTIRLSIGYAAGLDRFINITRAVEAKLKEKNT